MDVEIDKFYSGKKLNKSIQKSNDNFLGFVKDKIKVRIGAEFSPYIDYDLITINNKYVLCVKVKNSKSACYLDNIEFYHRTNPATERLEGPKLVEYIRNHFG